MSYPGVTRTGFGNKILPHVSAIDYADLWRNGTRGPGFAQYAIGPSDPLGVDGAWFFKKLGYGGGGASKGSSGAGRRRRRRGGSSGAYERNLAFARANLRRARKKAGSWGGFN